MRTLHLIVFLACAVALGACRPATEKSAEQPVSAAAPDPRDLNVDIGRYGVMLRQVHSLTQDRPGSAELDPTAPRELGRALRESVWQYNVERSNLCAKGLFTEVACGPAYEPVWISEPSDVEPTLQEIQSRSQALGEEIIRFWRTVCDDAESRVADPQERMLVCAIE